MCPVVAGSFCADIAAAADVDREASRGWATPDRLEGGHHASQGQLLLWTKRGSAPELSAARDDDRKHGVVLAQWRSGGRLPGDALVHIRPVGGSKRSSTDGAAKLGIASSARSRLSATGNTISRP